MTVSELRRMLADVPGDYKVILAKDGEGNCFSPLDTVWSGYFEDPDEKEMRPNAVVLWPVN